MSIGTVATWFLLFLTYSFIGWAMEVIVSVHMHHKPSNRGFLIGPLCPIYGFGVLLVSLLLQGAENIIEIFVVATLASAVLEYTTSLVMEKIFRVRWWDYSKDPLNLNGRVCLKNLVYFGIMGVIVMRFTNPFFLSLYNNINETVRIIIAAILLALMLADIGVSLWLIIKCRVTAGTLQIDATDEITANIREVLMKQGKLNRRLAKAFPEMEVKKKTNRNTPKRSSNKRTHATSGKSKSERTS